VKAVKRQRGSERSRSVFEDSISGFFKILQNLPKSDKILPNLQKYCKIVSKQEVRRIMAPKTRRELLKIQREMLRNRPVVRRKLAKSKKRVAPAFIDAVARHYKALDRLAQE
jgi:flagellar biosynthesis regulator FlbT